YAAPALRRALGGRPALEVRKRLEGLLEKALLRPPTGPELQALRAVEALEKIASPEARQVLRGLAKGAPEARLTREAMAALGRLTRRPVSSPGGAEGTRDRP